MRVNFGRRFLLLAVQTLTIFLILTAAQSVQSQPAKPEPPKTPDAKDVPKDTSSGNQPSGQTGTGQPSGQGQTGQTATGQTQAGDTKGQTPPVTKPADKPAALCRSPQQERDYQIAQSELRGIEPQIASLQTIIEGREERAARYAMTIAHYDEVISGKAELSEGEKADHIVPSAAKVDTQADLDEEKRDIDEEQKKLGALKTEAAPLMAKIAAFEKLAPCPKTPETATPETPGTKPLPGTPATPAVAGGCSNSTDADNLKEYQRLIAFYEKENKEIEGQLEKLDSDIVDTQGNKELDAGLKQGRLDEFKLRKTSLEERKASNQTVIDKFKLLVKAILEKKPCPPEEKKISKPETPGTGTPTRRTDRGRKDDDRKTKKKTSTDRTVRRTPSDGGTSDDARRSDDAARAVGTVIDLGMGIGMRRGGGGLNDRGDRGTRTREMSPRMRPE